jgi:hypothetical protein
LGEFSPFGRFHILFAQFLITEVARIFSTLFPQKKGYYFAKNDWATFWPIFSQTHLVTLP